MSKKLFVGFSVVIVLGMLLAACGPAATAAPAAGAAPAAAAAKEFKSKDPTTFVEATLGEPDVLDPALDYETAGSEVNQNVYENLVFYKKDSATEFVDMLASKHEVSADGKVYTFTIRPGVTFHEGQKLTATDAAYSLQRVLLFGGSNGPALLLSEPVLGIGVIDITELIDPKDGLVDDAAALAKVDAKTLVATCDKVQAAIKADDVAGTVTITLAQPFAPFLAILSHTVSSIMSKEWVVANGGWDGTCATWQKYYSLTAANDPIAEKANGTGPYQLVSWDHATKTVTLKAFDGYWRKDALWDGAKTGPAAIKNVIIKGVDEWGTRFAMLQAGDADTAIVDRSNISQVDPLVGERADFDVTANKFGDLKATSTADQPLRLYFGVPALTRTDIFLNEAVNIPKEGGIFTGTGTLSSKGIPANFFSDVNIRKGFNYAMDWDSYIKDYWQGEAVRLPYVLSLPGELGYDANGGTYPYDLAKAADAFKASTLKTADGKNGVWDTGFYLIAAYNTGNAARKAWLEILSAGLKKVNPKFDMEVLAVPWASVLHYQQAGNMPVYNIGWQEDIHDPHNWYSPYLVGLYGGKSGFPADVMATWKDYVNRGVAETDPAKRDAIYKELNQKVFDYCPFILGVLPTGRHYEQRWVQGYYNNPLYGGFYFYELSKK